MWEATGSRGLSPSNTRDTSSLTEGKKSTPTAEQEGTLRTHALLSLCQRPKPGCCCSLPTDTQVVASSTLCLLGKCAGGTGACREGKQGWF